MRRAMMSMTQYVHRRYKLQEDLFNKAALPKVMQTKSGMFGKMSQTKSVTGLF
jgi:hypothetical protein